jgi:hypothetical protein
MSATQSAIPRLADAHALEAGVTQLPVQTLAQGYPISKPVSAAELAPLLVRVAAA